MNQKKILTLSDYTPDAVNVKVSMAAMIGRLKALEAMAGDPGQVKEWINQTWQEAQECEVV
jgi:hypothetical protein